MPMKCVVCGQLTDAEVRAAEARLLNGRLTAELSEARGALKNAQADLWVSRTAVEIERNQRKLAFGRAEAAEAALAGRGSSTDRAPGRNPGDAGSSPAPSTPDEPNGPCGEGASTCDQGDTCVHPSRDEDKHG